MPKMRDKFVHCAVCSGTCSITANLDAGKVVKALMPKDCHWPEQCRTKFVAGVFSRPFGERMDKPEAFK